MATARHRTIWSDDSGAVILEMAVTALLFLTVLFGTVEGGNLFYQWNVATKATQLGARIAAVSQPVAQNLDPTYSGALTGMEHGALPGDPIQNPYDPAHPYFDCECRYVSGTPTCVNNAGAVESCGAFQVGAFNTIVYGRGDPAAPSSCGNATNPRNLGMCDVFPRITPQNVIIRYQDTGLGYAGRPGGMVPTITVSLTGLQFNWIALSGLLGLGPITMPGLKTTISGEDLQGS